MTRVGTAAQQHGRSKGRLLQATPLLIGLASALLELAVVAGTPTIAAAADTAKVELRLGSDVWPPFTDRAGRRRVATDVVEKALLRDNVTSTTEMQPSFEAVMEALRTGELDGSAAIWHTADREPFLAYSKPYLENRLVLLARRGTSLDADELSDLAGRKVGIVAGYAYHESASLGGKDFPSTTGPEYIEGPSDQENLQRLLRGEIDYMLAEELVIHEFFESHGERADILLEAGTTPMLRRSLHFAMRRDHPKADSIIANFDAAIRAMMQDGTFNQALGLTWLRVDLDGDGQSELVLGGTQAGTTKPDAGYSLFEGRPELSNPDSAYIIGGKRYGKWSEVPSQFKVPVEREVAWPEPTIRLMEF